ncbi:13004_t:CDS:2 [Ambispora gerdemannii]|uniref:mRNA 3'-end-processing protein n=1 Tax=Ambispora gerdemannii TaxID=144530 RepID=A0A9N9FMP8_9GLOM|nr:13004_t:CDS:2 [Ambispora gerdemannii]
MPCTISLFKQDYSDLEFDFEEYVRGTLGLGLAKEDKICQDFLRGTCQRGTLCKYKHSTKRAKAVVCKHWLRGLCKMQDQCEFLHEFNESKMPECWFYVKFGECTNEDCLYLHVDPESKIKECPYYARGFCKYGPNCNAKHVRKTVCQLYLTGFCPYGAECPNGHPKYDSIGSHQRDYDRSSTEESISKSRVSKERPPLKQPPPTYRPLSEVTCYKDTLQTDAQNLVLVVVTEALLQGMEEVDITRAKETAV